jgi:adenylate kinase family enzyme
MNQLFIMIVGFSGSGRTYLTKQIADHFDGDFNIVDVIDIHLFLNSTYPIMADNFTIKGQSFDIRQEVSDKIEWNLLEAFTKAGASVIYDSANLTKEKRSKVLGEVKKLMPKIKTLIIETKVSEDILLKELQGRDAEVKKDGRYPVWVDLYEKIQKKNYEKPAASEADKVLAFDRSNLNDIIKEVEAIADA